MPGRETCDCSFDVALSRGPIWGGLSASVSLSCLEDFPTGQKPWTIRSQRAHWDATLCEHGANPISCGDWRKDVKANPSTHWSLVEIAATMQGCQGRFTPQTPTPTPPAWGTWSRSTEQETAIPDYASVGSMIASSTAARAQPKTKVHAGSGQTMYYASGLFMIHADHNYVHTINPAAPPAASAASEHAVARAGFASSGHPSRMNHDGLWV